MSSEVSKAYEVLGVKPGVSMRELKAAHRDLAPAIATVTVTIDPETGLLAKPECPLRSRMTYPTGSQPTGYCNLSHAPPPKESRIKSLAKSVKRTLD